jgi:energy-converting hydrogenase Eha subunit H
MLRYISIVYYASLPNMLDNQYFSSKVLIIVLLLALIRTHSYIEQNHFKLEEKVRSFHYFIWFMHTHYGRTKDIYEKKEG